MSEDAQAEAEQIVAQYGRECRDWGYRGGTEVVLAHTKGDFDRLVAVVVAAIEVDAELSSERWVDDPVTAEERTHRAGRKLHTALGEVRAGKETG